MVTKVLTSPIFIVCTVLALGGCNRPVAPPASPAPARLERLAVGPNREAVSIPSDDATAALEASGGLSVWMQHNRLAARGTVTLYRSDDSFYLTEHDFEVFPWSKAVRISSLEPRGEFAWQVVDGQYKVLEGDPSLDVSPLAGSYRDYAGAILQIVTAPVRLLDQWAELRRQPTPMRFKGQWYQAIEATFMSKEVVTEEKGRTRATLIEPYWTRGIYFQNRTSSMVDRIWLANTTKQTYLIVQGYDYAEVGESGVQVPTKIEIFRSDAEGTVGERLAQIDVTGR